MEMMELVQKLSDPELNGRVPGTEGHRIARDLIIDQCRTVGLEPLVEGSWIQPRAGKVQNVLASKQGRSENWILVGAHYDHLDGCPGADDNAAAIGIVFEAVKMLQDKDLNCQIVVAFFDTEEPPYIRKRSMGSVFFHDHCQTNFSMDKLQCAIILDLCGHELNIEGREQGLFIIGGDTTNLTYEDLNELRQMDTGLDLYFLRDRPDYHFSDHHVFSVHGHPNLFLTCAPAYHYHTPDDIFDRLCACKMAQTAHLLTELILKVDQSRSGEKPDWRELDLEEVSRFVGGSITENGYGAVIQKLMRYLHMTRKVSLSEIQGKKLVSQDVPVVIESRAAIDALEQVLEDQIQTSGFEEVCDITVDVAFGSGQAKVFYNADLEYGYCRRPVCENRKWWNSFFLDRPVPGSKIPEFCEVNVSFNGSDGHTQGAFVGHHGRIYLVHRGMIKHLSRLNDYQGTKFMVRWGDTLREVIVVCEIGSPESLQQIAGFLKGVKRILDMSRPVKPESKKRSSTVKRSGLHQK